MDSGLKQRLVTGVILVGGVIVGVLLLPNLWFSVAALIVFISLAGWEWGRLVGFAEFDRGLYVAGLLLVAVIAYWWGDVRWGVIVLGVLAWIGALLLLALYERGSGFYQQQPWILRVAAFLILIPAWFALITLHQYYPWLVLYLIFLVAIADSGAYFSGKAFGKNKLAPQLSPGKTREGALGGLLGVALWSILGSLFFGLSASDAFYFIMLSILVGVMSISGDLFESLVKREAGMKDSGNILPGHGGILDRIDGLLASLPLFVLGVFWGGVQVAG